MIEIETVSKAFGPVVALDRLALRIEPGERVALVGSNGSGKSTLIRAIVGLLRIEGRIRIDGVDVGRDPVRALANVAYIPQVAPPLDAPVREVVRAVSRLRHRPEAATHARALDLGVDLDAVAATRLRDLSGGMKQKLLAALALATDAPILVADEPTASLDPAARAAFFAAVHGRPASSTLVLCSHRADEVRTLVDRVVELREGHVHRDGPVASVLRAIEAQDFAAPRAIAWEEGPQVVVPGEVLA